ncbi:hypothetical protein GH714_004920 [Hevea brasiliensis]|uniref:Cytochrome P450 n=1 Tax=Hevea brasiliensis TaxID=3981 RepID=A0A6A6MA50_HEVBR|nr:hypothetical protein GH714_004920 [Hevea brasiliensis]
MREVVELHRNSNLGDFLPVLQWVDFQGVEKRMVKLMKKQDKFFQHLLDEHRTRTDSSIDLDKLDASNKEQKKQTLIDLLLSMQKTDADFYTDKTIKGLVLALLVAGTESSATTTEWALSLLHNHPDAMHKAWVEINSHVGEDRLLDESDLPQLNYLQNVINETFRLFPPVPLLLPHESSEDCTVGGFHVPGGTMLLANLWTIHRDPKLWTDATKFMPERFESEDGEGYHLIPFGVGRRACPEAKLGRRVMGLTLGALIQSFELERIGEEDIDMMEGTGLCMPKAEPLEALCKPRRAMINLLSCL